MIPGSKFVISREPRGLAEKIIIICRFYNFFVLMFDLVLKYHEICLYLKNVDDYEHYKVLLDMDCTFLLKMR